MPDTQIQHMPADLPGIGNENHHLQEGTHSSKTLYIILGAILGISIILTVGMFLMSRKTSTASQAQQVNKQPVVSPEPQITLTTTYDNPFDTKSQYQNPFSTTTTTNTNANPLNGLQ